MMLSPPALRERILRAAGDLGDVVSTLPAHDQPDARTLWSELEPMRLDLRERLALLGPRLLAPRTIGQALHQQAIAVQAEDALDTLERAPAAVNVVEISHYVTLLMLFALENHGHLEPEAHWQLYCDPHCPPIVLWRRFNVCAGVRATGSWIHVEHVRGLGALLEARDAPALVSIPSEPEDRAFAEAVLRTLRDHDMHPEIQRHQSGVSRWN